MSQRDKTKTPNPSSALHPSASDSIFREVALDLSWGDSLGPKPLETLLKKLLLLQELTQGQECWCPTPRRWQVPGDPQDLTALTTPAFTTTWHKSHDLWCILEGSELLLPIPTTTLLLLLKS